MQTIEAPFTYQQPTFALSDLEGMTNAVIDDGYALVPGVLNTDEVASTRDAIDRLEPFGFDRTGDVDHYKCVFNRERNFFNYIDRPGIVELADSLMGDQCHIIGESAWRSRPGSGGWGVHIDEMFVPVPEPVFTDSEFRVPVTICTAHYYLSDILTEDLCPTYVVPGTHRSGRGPKAGEESWGGQNPLPVLVRAGDVLFFRCEVWHTGSKNRTSDQTRYLLQVHYSHRKVAQKFSPWPWHFNPEILAIATARQRRLLGEHPESNYG